MKITKSIVVIYKALLISCLIFTVGTRTKAQAFIDATADATALPVTIVSFSGSVVNNGIMVQWTTTSEINNSHFIVQKSVDGVSFNNIGTLTAKGSINTIANYALLDNASIDKGKFYYRLQQVDKDGKLSFSKVIVIQISTSSTSGITIYPSPITNQSCTVQLTKMPKGNYQIQMLNLNGSVISKHNYSQTGTETTIQLQLPNVVAGTYIIQVSSVNDGAVFSKKVLVL